MALNKLPLCIGNIFLFIMICFPYKVSLWIQTDWARVGEWVKTVIAGKKLWSIVLLVNCNLGAMSCCLLKNCRLIHVKLQEKDCFISLPKYFLNSSYLVWFPCVSPCCVELGNVTVNDQDPLKLLNGTDVKMAWTSPVDLLVSGKPPSALDHPFPLFLFSHRYN